MSSDKKVRRFLAINTESLKYCLMVQINRKQFVVETGTYYLDDFNQENVEVFDINEWVSILTQKRLEYLGNLCEQDGSYLDHDNVKNFGTLMETTKNSGMTEDLETVRNIFKLYYRTGTLTKEQKMYMNDLWERI